MTLTAVTVYGVRHRRGRRPLLLGVSRSTLYSALPELLPAQRDRDALDERLAQLPPDSRPGPPALEPYDALLTRTDR